MRGISIRFTTKPGASSTSTAVLLKVWHSARTSSFTFLSVLAPEITSTNFITGTGLKKCTPITFSGLAVTLASSVMLRLEVLVAKIASFLAMPSRVRKVSFFTSISSERASIMISASATSAKSSETVIFLR